MLAQHLRQQAFWRCQDVLIVAGAFRDLTIARPQTAVKAGGKANSHGDQSMGYQILTSLQDFLSSLSNGFSMRYSTEYGVGLGQRPSAVPYAQWPPEVCVQLRNSESPRLRCMHFVHRSLVVCSCMCGLAKTRMRQIRSVGSETRRRVVCAS